MRTSILQLCLAVPFLTANALVITESMHGGLGTGYFIAARLTDVAVGSTMGLLGTILLWRRFSSKRLPEHMREVIRLEGQFKERLLAGQQIDGHQLRVSLVRLRDAYDKALGDFQKRKRIRCGRRSLESSTWVINCSPLKPITARPLRFLNKK